MRKHLSLSTAIALGTLALFGLSSCDPYYYQGSVGGSYNYGNYPSGYASGYGAGWGYGNPTFTTSFFVSTGSPYWGYDPYCRAYYNYSRRCYYDPYLYGYYPVGYRPPIIVGVPHPPGYRSGYCPPPVRVTNVTLTNYNQRAERYGRLNHSWAREVRKFDYQRQASPGRGGQARPSGGYGDPRGTRQSVAPPRGSSFGGGDRRQATPQSAPRTTPQPRLQVQQPRVDRGTRGGGVPNQYNVPVTRGDTLGQTPDRVTRPGMVTPPARSRATPDFQPQLPRQGQPRATPTAPAAPRAAPQIERRMPDRSAAREAPRQVERRAPERVGRPAPEVAPAAPQPTPGPASDGGRPGRSRGREGG